MYERRHSFCFNLIKLVVAIDKPLDLGVLLVLCSCTTTTQLEHQRQWYVLSYQWDGTDRITLDTNRQSSRILP